MRKHLITAFADGNAGMRSPAFPIAGAGRKVEKTAENAGDFS